MTDTVKLSPDERLDDLQFKGLKVIQNSSYFSFGTDAVLLARFACPKDSDTVLDLGTGTGIIPIMTAGLCCAKRIVGIEIQQCMSEMASRSISLNALEDRVEILTMDIKLAADHFGCGEFSLVISNPPYIKAGSGLVNPESQKAISRHEVLCKLSDVAAAAGRLLKSGGRFCMVHKPERMIECFDSLRAQGIEPKRLQMIYPTAEKQPSAVLIEGVKGAKPGLRVLRQITLMDENGLYSRQLQKIYADEGACYFGE